jgi:hypothetical protein
MPQQPAAPHMHQAPMAQPQDPRMAHAPTAQTAPQTQPKAKTSLLSRFKKAPAAAKAAVPNAVPEAVKAPAAIAKPNSSLINASFLKGLAAGLVLAFAGTTILGKFLGNSAPVQRVSAPAQVISPAPVATAATTSEETTFLDAALGEQAPR